MNDQSSTLIPTSVSIIGGGNLGSALALGWARAGLFEAGSIHVTRRHASRLTALAEEGFVTGSDNRAAVAGSDCVILCVQPGQIEEVCREIADVVGERLVISVATGVTLAMLRDLLGEDVSLLRAMPNTAVSTLSSMTCLAAGDASEETIATGHHLFDALGRTLLIDEDMMLPATALCACGIAFFLRTIRAAAQGGTEIGFHADEALLLAAQTARGAADLLLEGGGHPESEIDRVTTPRGCTIAGLNELEHGGFSSAMIRGILTSARRAAELS